MTVHSKVDPALIRTLLEQLGEDPNRPGLLETPKRVAKAFAHWCGGYAEDPADILKVFPQEGRKLYDQMIFQNSIPLYSLCEHHMAPFFGVAHIAYIPGEMGIVGLSKLKRLVSIFARRLQVQERLTEEIANALNDHLAPLGAAVTIRARHMCMESRGIETHGTSTTTTALRGCMLSPACKSEFMHLVAIAEQVSKV